MSDSTEVRTVTRNRDNDELRPGGNKGIVFGYVDAVNGPGATEVPDFVPTRHELLQIARYWADIELDHEFFMATTGCVGSDWVREMSFAGRRLGRIQRVLGGDEVERVVQEVRKKFSASVDPRWWKAFVEGDRTELSRIADERNPGASEDSNAQ